MLGASTIGKGVDILHAVAELLGEGHQIVAATPVAKGDIGKILPLAGLSHEDIARLYNACDYAILPSRHEGWSLMMLESYGERAARHREPGWRRQGSGGE